MNAAPIYLLVNGETSGPHTEEQIMVMLDEGEIEPETLSCIEGMPGWRSIEETTVWSHGAVLRGIRPEVMKMVERIVALDVDLRSARAELVRIVGALGNSDISNSVGIILDVNTALLRNHRLYSSGQSDWRPDGADLWPAFRLLKSGKQTFARDWEAAWGMAGGVAAGSEMVALRNAPVWMALSDFGFPFPPFSMDRSFWIEIVSAGEARSVGITYRSEFMKFVPAKAFELAGII